jgi:hypothetical protein
MSEKEKVKKPFWKKWWVWVIALLIIVIANAGKDDKPTAVNAPSPASSPSNQSEQKPDESPENQEFKVGETIQMGDYKLTVNEVKKSSGGDFDKPKDGMEFVIVKVTIENAGKEKISYNPFDFKMANSQGQITDQTFTTIDSSTHLNSGELAPGGKVSGTIPFEQPKGDNKLQLQYQPNFWSDKTIKVNLQ